MTQITINRPNADQPKPQMTMKLRDPGSFYRLATDFAFQARSRGRPPSP